MSKKISKPKLRIAKSKTEVKGFQSLKKWETEVGKRALGPKEKKSWKIHPSEKQWRNAMAELGPVQKCILIDLAFYQRLKDSCYPGQKIIAKNLRISRKIVGKHLKVLEKKKFIKIVKTFGVVSRYKVLIKFY